MSEPRGRRVARLSLAAFLGAMGAAHLVARPTFEAIIPTGMPGDPALVNYAATAAEMGSAALLLSPRTARVGGLAAFATFAVVWVANLQHAIDGGIPGAPGVLGSPQVAWVRAPLQIPLLWWAWRVARPGEERPASSAAHQF